MATGGTRQREDGDGVNSGGRNLKWWTRRPTQPWPSSDSQYGPVCESISARPTWPGSQPRRTRMICHGSGKNPTSGNQQSRLRGTIRFIRISPHRGRPQKAERRPHPARTSTPGCRDVRRVGVVSVSVRLNVSATTDRARAPLDFRMGRVQRAGYAYAYARTATIAFLRRRISPWESGLPRRRHEDWPFNWDKLDRTWQVPVSRRLRIRRLLETISQLRVNAHEAGYPPQAAAATAMEHSSHVVCMILRQYRLIDLPVSVRRRDKRAADVSLYQREGAGYTSSSPLWPGGPVGDRGSLSFADVSGAAQKVLAAAVPSSLLEITYTHIGPDSLGGKGDT
ncbi:uncharacterized protein C8Q71DRAFT_727644 [Rhodofomes roseus]|uniref:Uncharacterized protein n=1 Tax=Rhodofomes roseus TaxID=34475 RepID=A0ABQ8K1J6_9APHY|nr:uncharacterized protein C8Q71DRAFT_727644 [Rhodofomes roseus]KAH9830129.1 hypothetical protein C8Q71DRAFT_727644 [Rhodofomes roseus]